jgi:hypothetical protein
VELFEKNFFDGSHFFRVVPKFLVQVSSDVYFRLVIVALFAISLMDFPLAVWNFLLEGCRTAKVGTHSLPR